MTQIHAVTTDWLSPSPLAKPPFRGATSWLGRSRDGQCPPYTLGQPLPCELGPALRAVVLVPGALLYFWAWRTLGQMFDAASGCGVRLQVEHRLVTTGPYAQVRHPMYVEVILTGFGGALIYHTWVMALFLTTNEGCCRFSKGLSLKVIGG